MLVVDDITLVREWDGVTENDAATMRLYPNPATDKLQVESAERIERYEVYDMKGALLRQGAVGSHAFGLDLEALPAGTYLLKTVSEGNVTTRRFMKN